MNIMPTPINCLPTERNRRSRTYAGARWLMAAFLGVVLFSEASARSAHFTTGVEAADKFGVHEIVLTGNGTVANPFDTLATVKFSPPSGEKNAKTVNAFHDGGNTWRARVYVSETGDWKWSSRCDTDTGLNGKTGTFKARNSDLRGRLLPHSKNPRHWQTENGRWFLNLNDTSYYFLTAYSAYGAPVSDADAKAYVRDLAERGITSMRSFTLVGPSGYLEDGPEFERRWREGVFEDAEFTRPRLDYLRVADERLRLLLNEYPDMKMQLVLFPRGSRHGRDANIWANFSPAQKERLMRTMIARYAAYPQIFWLVANDVHYGPKHPNNNAFAREVGEYFRRHDPWRHPMSTGHARKIDFFFSDEDWATYIHVEDAYDVGAAQYEKYHRYAKPVFLGEDRYEHDHLALDPVDMRYFQRRLFWAWSLAGGSANYGGRWWVLLPYSKTGHTPSPINTRPANKGHVFTAQLTGLDSVKFIRDYFTTRKIELSDFEPDHALVNDPEVKEATRAPKLMRRGQQEFLIYHPNAAADDRNTRADESKTPSVILDLSAASGKFSVEWYRAADGTAQPGGVIDGGKSQTLRSPWRGQDCVVRLRRK